MPSFDAPDSFCEVPSRRLSFEISKFVKTGFGGARFAPGANFESRDARILFALIQWELEQVTADVRVTFKGNQFLLQNAQVTAVQQSEGGNVFFTVEV